jgi:pyruvate carboxylase
MDQEVGMKRFEKLLVANRGEIAIRVLRAANELGKRTVAIYAEEDKLSLHRFKSDEAYQVGESLGPVKAYLDIPDIIRIAKIAGADALHPGYGLLSENPDLAEACADAGIAFIGPKPETMRLLGDKVSARNVAIEAGVPVVPATGILPSDPKKVQKLADEVGYPLMLKASWGGGGRGMRPIREKSELIDSVRAGSREAEAAFGRGDVYLEKLIERARHLEVQILGDQHGHIVHLFERDCTVQRRNQKVVERAPAPQLDEGRRGELCELALKIMRHAGYECAGTVEFLEDVDSGNFYFIEVNPRIQVEHTVTEEVTGIDIVKAQIRISEGGRIGQLDETGVPPQHAIALNGHAMQCRITTEDPMNNFIPDYGRITAYRGATGFGIRLDGGTAYSGAVITRYYDSLLEKVTAWAPTPEETIARMDRALREFRIRGVATNLAFVENLIAHPTFKALEYTTRFIDQHDELFDFAPRRDRATRLLTYLADVTVNGHPEVKDRQRPPAHALPPVAPKPKSDKPPAGTKDLLDELGPVGFANWMKKEKRLLITDTTMRDAHQSLLATRMRSHDMTTVAKSYATNLPQMFSMECWGGATFDVSMRFLQECPWERLRQLREAMPNILLQMLFRGSNGVGYTSYPDNVVSAFTRQAAQSGIDLFRIFDALNWVDNMKVSIETVLETGKLCEAAICYTGDIFDPKRKKYDLDYYLKMARDLKASGAHIIGLKDMAGVCKPEAAATLVRAIKRETGLPIHFHTHDASGISAASILAAADAGADAVDLAMDSLSGLTSQPNLGAVVAALARNKRATGLDPAEIRSFSDYWEAVRFQYAAFESDMRAGSSEIYLHEMPGGQFTNLKEQARAMGLEGRWHEVAKAYADVNMMFGDVIKVTPSSKIVGDMALSMVAGGLSREDVEDPKKDVSFPESVVGFFRGDIGQPPGGFPKDLQKKVLKGDKALRKRAGETMKPADLKKLKKQAEEDVGREITDEELCSYLMYPKVFVDYARNRATYGPVEVLPTPVYFYGMPAGDEIGIDLEPGKTMMIRCVAIGEPDDEGQVRVFFEVNGQPRVARVNDRQKAAIAKRHPKAEDGNPAHLAAPMPGMIATLAVKEGQEIKPGDLLMTIEAMKMETAINADRSGTVTRLHVSAGSQIDAKDLLLELQ